MSRTSDTMTGARAHMYVHAEYVCVCLYVDCVRLCASLNVHATSNVFDHLKTLESSNIFLREHFKGQHPGRFRRSR
jgi:hypothetical protein